MTPTPRECLDALKRLTVDGVPPSYDELAVELGLASKSRITELLSALEAQGYIARPERHRARCIVVLAQSEAYTPTALDALSTDELKGLLTHVCGLLAYRCGPDQTDAMMRRIGDRLCCRPRSAA